MKHASTKNTGHARGNAEKGKKVPPFAGASILNDKKDVKRLMQAAKKPAAPLVKSGKAKKFQLAPELLVKIHDHMVKTRSLEERMIKMFKQSDGYFWLGGPGEEAFAVPLGMQGKIGQGVHYDFWHLHYRSSGILMPMGLDPMGCIRQMKNVASDPHSGGRNFANHLSVREWNVVPITSTI